MRVFKKLDELPKFRNPVITIGSFDGLHKGHLKIIDQVKALAKNIDGESTVITFEPHPRLIVYPQDDSLKLITTIEEKIQLFSEIGIENLVIVPFTIEFSQLSADEYIQKFLVGRFNPKIIVIGYDHRFGLNRMGNIDYLKWYCKDFDFDVLEINKLTIDAVAVSSTKIRRFIESKDIALANQLLGHPFCLSGKVIHGLQIGNKIGYPTANIDVKNRHKLIPPNGVYAVKVRLNDGDYEGMLYIGNRPTLPQYGNRTIEVNIFDFQEIIYGQQIWVDLVAFIRGDQKFENLELLKQQLAQDKLLSIQALKKDALRQAHQMNWPAVAVAILNYNGRHYLEQFLPKVFQSQYENFQIYVIDNCSTDDSLEWLAANYPEVEVIALDQNYGFAEGYNKGLRKIGAPYYILLNSDIEVTENWIQPIIQLMETFPDIAACQPIIKSYQEKDTFEYAGAAGGWIDYLGYPFCRGRVFDVTEKDQGQYPGISEIFWASGAALFIKAPLFHQIGGFDGKYFAHSEEIDLCWRLKRAGYRIMINGESVVYHLGGGTLNYQSPRKTFLNFKNSLFTLVKNESFSKLLWLIPARLVLDGIAGLLFLYQRKWEHIWAILRAHFNFYNQFFQLIQERKAAKERIRKLSIHSGKAEGKLSGRYGGSIVWAYFGQGRKIFKDIVK